MHGDAQLARPAPVYGVSAINIACAKEGWVSFPQQLSLVGRCVTSEALHTIQVQQKLHSCNMLGGLGQQAMAASFTMLERLFNQDAA